jgi:nicotinate-nucleotide pyrophosphorylase (carboxylating)
MKLAQIELWRSLLRTGLTEDGSLWDWTARGTTWSSPDLARKTIQAQVIAKSSGIWAAASLTEALQTFTGIEKAKSICAQSAPFSPGTCLVELAGSAEELLALERPFLNLAAYVSGIATRTHRFQGLIQEAARSAGLSSPPRLTLTRKTLPHYRDVAILGVLAGGGHPHRVSLSGGVLIKENHIAATGSIARAVAGVRLVAPHGLKVEVEVRDLEELQQALQAKVEGVLLDNFTPQQVAAAVALIASQQPEPHLRPFVEVSGGLEESTLERYVQPGVDVLSVGALTHSVTGVDLSLLVIHATSSAPV